MKGRHRIFAVLFFMVGKMKKIVLAFVAVSLLLTGCSDDGEKKHTSDSKENVASAMETLTTYTGNY